MRNYKHLAWGVFLSFYISYFVMLYNPSGGNAWNANPIYVISLEDKYFLKNLGQVSRVYDIDKDGIDELIIYEDIWEGGLGL